jgi:hypothetical protein
MRFIVLLLPVLLLACRPTATTSTSTTKSDGKYSEDLSVLRAGIAAPADTANNSTASNKNIGEPKRDPAKYVEARHTVNNSIDVVLDSIDRINLSFGLVDGYTIQLYSGVKREEALEVKKQASTLLNGFDADVQFVQPNFRVRAGKYINRIDAQKDFMAVKKFFPNAIIIPERIPFR